MKPAVPARSLDWPASLVLGVALAAITLFGSGALGMPPALYGAALALANVLLFLGSQQRVRHLRRAHPLWGRDPIYPVLVGFSHHLRTYQTLLVVGVGAIVLGTASFLQPIVTGVPTDGAPDAFDALRALLLVSLSAPWAAAARRLHVKRPMPRPLPFDLAENRQGSAQPADVLGVRVNDADELLIMWRVGGATLSLPVHGIRVPPERRGDWLRDLDRAVVQGPSVGRGYPMHDLPLMRLADGREHTRPVVLVDTTHGEWERRVPYGNGPNEPLELLLAWQFGDKCVRFSVLADCLVRWGYAVRHDESDGPEQGEHGSGQRERPRWGRDSRTREPVGRGERPAENEAVARTPGWSWRQ